MHILNLIQNILEFKVFGYFANRSFYFVRTLLDLIYFIRNDVIKMNLNDD